MKGLLIKDELRWHDSWSAQLGEKLSPCDSSNNLLIFDESCREEDILAIISEARPGIYLILDLEKGTEDDFDFLSDSGTYYRKRG